MVLDIHWVSWNIHLQRIRRTTVSLINTISVISTFFFYSSIISKFSLMNMHYLYNVKNTRFFLDCLIFFLMTSLCDKKHCGHMSQKKVEEHPILLLMPL